MWKGEHGYSSIAQPSQKSQNYELLVLSTLKPTSCTCPKLFTHCTKSYTSSRTPHPPPEHPTHLQNTPPTSRTHPESSTSSTSSTTSRTNSTTSRTHSTTSRTYTNLPAYTSTSTFAFTPSKPAKPS
ncbi:hypothetical protein BS17DRAFT_822114 [Gyrodon lividus]|nr:hypothetical protein BS17DRAFT_822114 [Gyrodon lividus]